MNHVNRFTSGNESVFFSVVECKYLCSCLYICDEEGTKFVSETARGEGHIRDWSFLYNGFEPNQMNRFTSRVPGKTRSERLLRNTEGVIIYDISISSCINKIL